MAVVVDASALLYAGLAKTAAAAALRRRLVGEVCHAPHLLDAEVGNVLRRKVLRGELESGDAVLLMVHAATLVDLRYEMTGALGSGAWALRDSLTFYDAVYAALAQALDLPLLTADARLARAPGLPCRVELVATT